MNIPGFGAEASLNEMIVPAFRGSGAERTCDWHDGSLIRPAVVPPLPPCGVICGLCEDAGGICIRVRGGCLCI